MGDGFTGWTCDVCGIYDPAETGVVSVEHHTERGWKWFENFGLNWIGLGSPDMCAECIERYPKIFADFASLGNPRPIQ